MWSPNLPGWIASRAEGVLSLQQIACLIMAGLVRKQGCDIPGQPVPIHIVTSH